MNSELIYLIGLLRKYSGGEIHSILEYNLRIFADESLYQINTIEDLIEAMEVEMSYWEE